MKLGTTLAILSCVLFGSCLGQRINIGFPADGTSVSPGSNITVEVDRPNSLSGSQEVAIVIAIQSCASSPCAPPSDILGSILYSGAYNPQFQPNAPGFKPPHQNFTVFVPPALASGSAQLSVTHLSLIGAGPAPFMEQQNITLQIADAQ